MTNPQTTLKALYDFTRDNYVSLKADYNKLPANEKGQLPITLFIIGVFANILEDVQKESQVDADKSSQS